MAPSEALAITVRYACPADLAGLCLLYYEFNEYLAQGVPDRVASLGPLAAQDWIDIERTLDAIARDADAALLVADLNGRVTGLAEVYVRHAPADDSLAVRRYGYLQSLFVVAALRHHGIGRQLVEAAAAWARQRGAIELQLDIWEFARGPFQFYSRLGFGTLRRTLARPVG